MKQLLIFFVFVICSIGANSQNKSAEYLKEHAVRINKDISLSDSVYNLLSGYRLIMVGEMHGTQEPAKFVIGLMDLFAKKKDSVQVGLEIPSGLMLKYLKEHTDSSIYTSEFFAKGFDDGRSSYSWAEIISNAVRNPMVNIFFYDVNNGEPNDQKHRDSMMYIHIKKRMLEHPDAKMITISGNAHNMMVDNNGTTPAALYLKNDQALHLGNTICTLLHWSREGTMLNNSGKGAGLELKEVKREDDVFSQSVNSDNYVILYSSNLGQRYSGVFYTKYMTAAKMVKEK